MRSSIFLKLFIILVKAKGCVKLRYFDTSIFPFTLRSFNSIKVFINDATPDVVINATASSLGGEELRIPDGVFSGDSIAYDMMYGPSAQNFLSKAAKKGATKTADGLGMLVEQAAESFLIWRGVRPNAFEVIRHLREG